MASSKKIKPVAVVEAAPVVVDKQPDLGDDVAIAVVTPMGNVIEASNEAALTVDGMPVAKKRTTMASGNICEEY